MPCKASALEMSASALGRPPPLPDAGRSISTTVHTGASTTLPEAALPLLNSTTATTATTTTTAAPTAAATSMASLSSSPAIPPPIPNRRWLLTAQKSSSLELSRRDLKHGIQARRTSLTRAESDFLDDLAEFGEEVELQRALKKLQDDNIFPLPHELEMESSSNSCTTSNSNNSSRRCHHQLYPLPAGMDQSNNTWPANFTVGAEREVSTMTLHSEDGQGAAEPNSTVEAAATAASGLSSSLTSQKSAIARWQASSPSPPPPPPLSGGSDRRQALLETRKKESMVFGKMWKAHENGLSVSANASRRSLLVRQATGSSRRDLLAAMDRSDNLLTSSSVNHNNHSMTSNSSSNNNNSRRQFLMERSDNALSSSNARSTTYLRSESTSSGMQMLLPLDASASDSRNSRRMMMSLSSRNRTSNSSSNTMRSNLLRSSGSAGRLVRSVMHRRASSNNMAAQGRNNHLMTDNLTDNNRRTSWSRVGGYPSIRRSVNHAAVAEDVNYQFQKNRHHTVDLQLLTTTMPRPNPKKLERMTSDSTRKSVTFGDLPTPRDDSFFRSIQKVAAMVQESSPSKSPTPSLHLAQPVRSQSFRSTASSDTEKAPPSIHLAHPIGSQSFHTSSSVLGDQQQQASSSTPSLHLAHPIQSLSFGTAPGSTYDARDPSEASREEKKVMDSTDAATTTTDNDDNDDETSSIPSQVKCFQRPVMIRAASNSFYDEEGIEIADLISESLREREEQSHHHEYVPIQTARRLESLVSFGDSSTYLNNWMASNSFDECLSKSRVSSIFRKPAPLRRSLSDDDLNGILLGPRSKALLHESSSLRDVYGYDEDSSWQLDDEFDDDQQALGYYDPWKVIEDEYENGYGGGGTLSFLILGTSADDIDSHPHVLSPPLMESLLAFVPWNQQGSNFWMKYSLVRDGASFHTFLQSARGSKYTFLAIETVDGEVFGAFTSEPWRKNWNYFGGYESFLWRLRNSRRTKCTSIIDQAQKESEIDVYPFTGENDNVQLCTTEKLGVGGGSGSSEEQLVGASRSSEEQPLENDIHVNEHEWGFGLTIQKDWIHGTSSPCLTFGSPSLSREHADGSVFEIMNLELWTLTPCASVEQAEKMELGKLFLESHSRESY